MRIAVYFWTLYVGKNGGAEFWQIVVNEKNVRGLTMNN